MMTDSLDLFEESHALFGDVQFAHGSPDAEFRYQLRHLTRPPCSGGGQMNQLKAKQVNQNGGINELRLTLANVNTEDSIKLMSHYVWNSALLMAHLIEAGEIEVQHKSVCELGAGAGLPSILSAIYGAEKVCITDYPDEVIIRNLRRNCDANLSSSPRTNCAICPFRWGDSVPEPLRAIQPIDLILLADTLWMSDQHDLLLKSLENLITYKTEIWIICGLHTTMRTIDSFVTKAMETGFSFDSRKLVRIRNGWEEEIVDGDRVWFDYVQEEEVGEYELNDVNERKRFCVVLKMKKV